MVNTELRRPESFKDFDSLQTYIEGIASRSDYYRPEEWIANGWGPYFQYDIIRMYDGLPYWSVADNSGRKSVVEENSSDIKGTSSRMMRQDQYDFALKRIMTLQVWTYDSTQILARQILKTAPVELTVAGGAGLAPEAILVGALGAGKQAMLWRVRISVNSKTANATGKLSFLDGSGGAVLDSIWVSKGMAPVELDVLLDLGTANTAIYAVIDEAGETIFGNDDQVLLTGYYMDA